MIFPNGSFRLADKKDMFLPGDNTTIFEQEADIVIIGSGNDDVAMNLVEVGNTYDGPGKLFGLSKNIS